MQQILEPKTIKRTQAFESSYFGIDVEDSPHIFSILRDKMYSDKIMAVIREYCCNAQDAHVEAGKSDLPIEVHFPTQLEPWFSVTDWGPGLTEDEVRNLYVKYGKSTKRNTNAQVGMLGLGCKSAFAYTDTFTVTSRYQGTKTYYTAIIDESGRGQIIKTLVEPTTEENGITVQIPVNQQDIRAFSARLYIFSEWTPIPKINIQQTITPFESLLESTDPQFRWKIINGKRDLPSVESIHVIMGNVIYQVEGDKLEKPTHPTIYSSNTRYNYSYNNYGAVIHVPIGSVDIAASRESLEYTRKTQAYLTQLSIQLQESVHRCIQTKIESAPSLLEAKQALATYNIIKDHYITQKRTFVWRSYPLRDNQLVAFNSSADGLVLLVNSHYSEPQKCSSYSISSTKKTLLVERDTSQSWVKKIHHYLIQHPEYSEAIAVEVIDSCRQAYEKEYHLSLYSWVPVSSLPDAPPEAQVHKVKNTEASLEKHKKSIFTFTGKPERSKRATILSHWWTPVQVIPEGPKLYLEIDRFLPLGFSVESLQSVLKQLTLSGVTGALPVVFGIKDKVMEKLKKKDPEWIDFSSWLAEMLALSVDPATEASLKLALKYSKNNHRYYDTIKLYAEKLEGTWIGDRLRDAAVAHDVQTNPKLAALLSLYQNYSQLAKQKPLKEEEVMVFEEINKKYCAFLPLLHTVGRAPQNSYQLTAYYRDLPSQPVLEDQEVIQVLKILQAQDKKLTTTRCIH